MSRSLEGDVEIEKLVESLESTVEGKVARNEPIARFTSFRLGGPALVFVEPVDSEDLMRAAGVISAWSSRGDRSSLPVGRSESGPPLVVGAAIPPEPPWDIPIVTLGRGTNLLVSDSGFRGVVIRLGEKFDWITSEGSSITAGASTALPQVANRAARLSLTGLEFSIAIPATVGGAVKMNAGAHGSSISDVLEQALVCRLETGDLDEVKTAELEMSYRRTALRDHDVVCSARFDLTPGDRKTILQTMAAYRSHRTETQPLEAHNAGSMFKNPEGDAAGRLIESVGLKGFRVGGAEVSRKHANFFLAHASATAQDVFDVMAEVQRVVAERSGIQLEPEVRLVGEFDRSEGLISRKSAEQG